MPVTTRAYLAGGYLDRTLYSSPFPVTPPRYDTPFA